MSITLMHHLPVPMKAHAFQSPEDVVGSARHFAGRIQILYSHQPLPSTATGFQETTYGRHHGPHVKAPRRRGGKPPDVRTDWGHPRVNFLYLILLGPSSPKRFFRFSSYSLYVPSNQYA